MNQNAPETSGEQEKKDYSLEQRAKDLFDFPANFDPQKDRSGKISGNLLQEVDWENVGGNKDKSFLTNGTNYLTEVNVNATEKLWRDYTFEGQVFLRKTDNVLIENRRDLRLKDLNLKVLNPNNMAEFGDFYGDFSPFILSNSLEGFHVDLQPFKDQRLQAVAGRRYHADLTAGLYQRDVAGGKYDVNLFQDSRVFKRFRVGAQAINSRDDKGSLSTTFSPSGQRINVLENSVYGIDGDIALKKYLSMNYEVAQSMAIQDVKSPVTGDIRNYGTAVRIQPALRFQKLGLRYLFYYGQPKFYTDIGSAIPDRVNNQFNFNANPFSWLGFNFTENLYHNHLQGSSQPRRTDNHEEYMSLSLKPLPKRPSLSLRPYVNLLHASTDDIGDQGKNKTQTVGLALDDSFGRSGWYSLFYENREFVDLSTKVLNDYFNRLGFTVGGDRKIFGRRLYGSISPSLDFHKAKQTLENKKDVFFNLPFNLQFDLFTWCTLRSAYNLIENDGSQPLMNFHNQLYYGEVDLLMNRKRDMHLISRGERNVFSADDPTQRYNETRFTFKYLSNF